jgi:hypothetical protein
MPVPIESRAKKSLHKLASFKQLDSSSNLGGFIKLSQDEIPYGIYENEPGKREGSVLVTDKGLYVFGSTKVDFINYDDISTTDWASHDKSLMDAHPDKRIIVINVTDGKSISLPITGSTNGFADITSFSRFLGGAIRNRQIVGEKTWPHPNK